MHAALALQALKENGLAFSSFGMGGPKLRAQGMALTLDCRELSVIGIFEVLVQYRRLLKKLTHLRDHLRREKPDLLIIVDYPDFNLKLAETANKMGIPVLFYISPQVWAWRAHRVKRIGRLVSMMAVIFPFEVPFYKKVGIPVCYVGHPLVDEVKCVLDKKTAKQAFSVDNGQYTLGILPGSRDGEVKRVLPIMLDTIDKLANQFPDLNILLPRAGTLNQQLLSHLLQNHKNNITVINERAYDVMQACDVVMSASGTATLETALMGTPMVIVYKVNPASYAIMRRLITIKNIGLVNIVAGKPIVREFVQKKAVPSSIAKELSRLLSDQVYSNMMREELAIVREKMGEGGASKKVARLIQQILMQVTQTKENGDIPIFRKR